MAIAISDLTADMYTPEHTLREWVTAQIDCGNALAILGERERGTQSLKQAEKVFRLVEKETRDRLPPIWALAQNNLGNVLQARGQAEKDTSLLYESVAAYELALGAKNQQADPSSWANTQNNLGNTLVSIWEREGSVAVGCIEKAIQAFNRALEIRTPESDPSGHAQTQLNLGNAFKALGVVRNDTAQFMKALTKYECALEGINHDRDRFEWAKAKENMAELELILAHKDAESWAKHLQKALDSVDDALEVYSVEGSPFFSDKAERLRTEIVTKIQNGPTE